MGVLKSSLVRFVCPVCKQPGTVDWDAPQQTWGHERRRSARTLSAGFVAVDFSSKADVRVECAVCRVPVKES